MLTITALTNPHLFPVLVALDGASERPQSPPPTAFNEVPSIYLSMVQEAEKELEVADLTYDEAQALVAGEVDDIAALVAAKGLHYTDRLLNGYFEGWPVDGRYRAAEKDARMGRLRAAVFSALDATVANGHDPHTQDAYWWAQDLLGYDADVNAAARDVHEVAPLVVAWRQTNPKQGVQ
jgi:hypothetical protein